MSPYKTYMSGPSRSPVSSVLTDTVLVRTGDCCGLVWHDSWHESTSFLRSSKILEVVGSWNCEIVWFSGNILINEVSLNWIIKYNHPLTRNSEQNFNIHAFTIRVEAFSTSLASMCAIFLQLLFQNLENFVDFLNFHSMFQKMSLFRIMPMSPEDYTHSFFFWLVFVSEYGIHPLIYALLRLTADFIGYQNNRGLYHTVCMTCVLWVKSWYLSLKLCWILTSKKTIISDKTLAPSLAGSWQTDIGESTES